LCALTEGAAGRGTTASDAIAPMFAKAYPNIGMGANEKILLSNKGRTMKKVHGNSMLSRRRIIKGAGVLAAGIAAPAFLRIRSAYAAYPERPVKIVVANTPGGPSDIVGRVVAATLQQSTGKTFIIENIGGAGSNIGMGHVARSDPDGYTILLATNAYSINATLYNKIPYDPLKDFVGVCELATSPNTFAVKSELPAKTIKEFVALARANPDKFNVATPPIGTTPQLQAEVLKIREKLPKLESVVFKGGGDALQALLSGTVQLSSGALPPAAPHIKAGTLRCLAVTGETRWPDLPDVPTMVEAGYKDFVFAVDTVLLAPAKTPPENIKWLEQETLKVLSTPEMKEKLYISGFQVRPKGADAAWARVNKEIDVFRDVINQAGIPKL
jgi:tripartite-type tricarboxylate transporter receptor subunit TctC